MAELPAVTAGLRDAQAAFAALIESLRPALHRYCTRMTGSVLDGEDVVQETLAQACYRLGLRDPERAIDLRPWLFTIAHHKCVDFLRRRQLAPTVELDDIPAEATMAYEVRDLASRAFARVMQVLPPRERAAVILKDVLDYSLDDIAAILETTAGGVKAALHRGRGKLVAATGTLAIDREVPPLPIADYLDAFNRRDWAALLALLAGDVDVELVGHVHRRGRDAVAANYLTTYERLPFRWKLASATVDGEAVIVCLREEGTAWIPRHAMRVEWRDDRVARIRDYSHIAYVLDDAEVTERTW